MVLVVCVALAATREMTAEEAQPQGCVGNGRKNGVNGKRGRRGERRWREREMKREGEQIWYSAVAGVVGSRWCWWSVTVRGDGGRQSREKTVGGC